MARYLLIAVEDDSKANALMEKLKPIRGLEIVGLFAKPRTRCQCTKVKDRGFTRGAKYGWWVCDQCGRPTKAWGDSHQAVVSQAVNLLDSSSEGIARQEQKHPDMLEVKAKKRRY